MKEVVTKAVLRSAGLTPAPRRSTNRPSMAAPVTSPKPVYALLGDDSFLQLQALQNVSSKLPRDASRVEFDGERAELSDVLDELRSFAMFGGGKIVVIRGADEFITRYREQLEDYLA